ncbi:hypothetical protein D3C80_1533080 [compost metagenome]
MAHKNDVGTGFQSSNRSFRYTDTLGYGMHLKAIRYDDSLIIHFMAKQILKYLLRDRSWNIILFKSRENNMRRHDAIHILLNSPLERNQLNLC